MPSAEVTVRLPNDGEAQSLVAWAHDHGAVETGYETDSVVVRFRGRPETVQQFRARADAVA